MSDLEIKQKEILEAANYLHQLLYQLQNSGETDEYRTSLLTSEADIFREKILVRFESENTLG